MRKQFRTLILVCAFVAFAHASAASTQVAVSSDLPADTAAYVQEVIDNGDLIGVIVGMIDGDSVMIRGFGLASKETGKAPDADTVFEIGSITKTFTSTLLAEEVLAGRVNLSDPVQKYLPQGTVIPQVGDRPITLEDLATHRSGLPRLPPNMTRRDPADPYADFDAAKLWEAVQTVKPARGPGVSYEYSNFAVGLLGELVARESRTTYRQLVHQRIFKPLGMTHSDTLLSPALSPYAAQGHDRDGKPVKHWTITGLAGAGAINSSMTDMLAYLRANMAAAAKTGGSSALNQAMTLAQQPRADRALVGGRIGLNWSIGATKPVVQHDGGTAGFSSYIGFTTDGKRGVVVLANISSDTTDTIGLHLLDPTTALPPLRKTIALPQEKLVEYVGRYSAAAAREFTVTQGDSGLQVQLTNQPAVPVYATAADRFFYRVVTAQIDFDRDDAGKVYRLVLHQNGNRMRAPRIGADGKPVAQPARLALTPAQLDAYVGQYRLTPTVTATITRDGDKLIVQTTAEPAAMPVFSEKADHFEFETRDVELDFERDAAGRVIAVQFEQGPNKRRGERVQVEGSAQ